MEHPAAPLLAADLGHLQHTNTNGEQGMVHIPGFVSNAGMSADQTSEVGVLAQAIAEAIIETLEQKHGYRVIHESGIKAQIKAGIAEQGGPTEAPPSKCQKCRKEVFRPRAIINVAAVSKLMQAHEQACR